MYKVDKEGILKPIKKNCNHSWSDWKVTSQFVHKRTLVRFCKYCWEKETAVEEDKNFNFKFNIKL